MSVVIGMDATLTIDNVEIKNCRDVVFTETMSEADVTTRDNNGYRATAATLSELTLTFTAVCKTDDTAIAVLAAKRRTPLEVEISNTFVGGSLAMMITEVVTNQNLEEAITYDFTLKGTDGGNFDAVNNNHTGGGP